jgi:hypothetical protein
MHYWYVAALAATLVAIVVWKVVGLGFFDSREP